MIQLLLTIAILGLIGYLIVTYIPMLPQIKTIVIVVFVIIAIIYLFKLVSFASAPVTLLSDTNFSVLAGSTITNTGSTVLSGELGLNPGTSVTGSPVASATHIADADAITAQTDLVTAYNNVASQGPTSPIVADLAGQTLLPGVYNSASSIANSGSLTLDAAGNPNAVFIFQAGSTLTTGSGSSVNLINGAQACNVFWQVGSSATLGTNSNFVGNILAMASITVTTGVGVNGRLLARTGAVTLDTDTVNSHGCSTSIPSPTTTVSSPSSSSGSSGSSINNICNLATRQVGYQSPGSPLPVGWAYSCVATTTPIVNHVVNSCLASRAAYLKCFPSNGKE